MDGKAYYFDHAAATPADDRVLQAMLPFFGRNFYNPSATYGPAREVSAALAGARSLIAHWLGSRPSEVIFTAGGTEADNLAVHGVMRRYAASGANLVVSAIEHDAVLLPASNYDVRLASVTPQGFIDLDDLGSKIDSKTVLVSLMYANNEIGTIQPLRKAAAMIHRIRDERRAAGNALPIYLHTDACQAANYLDLHVARLGVDMMTINGGKLYGPKQSAVLYVKAGIQLEPIILGGGQEQGLRSGTENVAASVGLATALDIAQKMRQDEAARLHKLQARFIGLINRQLPGVCINGSLSNRLPNNLHLTVPGQDNERLLLRLEAAGVLASAGSACSASSDEPSHVLSAIGLSDQAARSSLRFSLGRGTDDQAISHAFSSLASIIKG